MEGNAVRLLRGLLREPLVHFCIAGAAMFGAYYWFSDRAPETLPDGQTIEISENDIRRMVYAWIAQGRMPLTPAQLQSLVDRKIAEEVLYREGLALGLDRNDEIIRRRVVQKMNFLAADVAALQEPDRVELAAWFSENPERFVIPPRASFRHLYFSPDVRGGGTRDDAEAALKILTDSPSEPMEVAALADPFMLRSRYRNSTPDFLLREFGPSFAMRLFELEPGGWRGPIESGYGWHLVWIEAMEPARIPAFEEVEADVRSAWIDTRFVEVKREVLEEMLSRYTVIQVPLDTVDLDTLFDPPSANPPSVTVPQ